jgi:type II secretory pathway pseudopilin PulG
MTQTMHQQTMHQQATPPQATPPQATQLQATQPQGTHRVTEYALDERRTYALDERRTGERGMTIVEMMIVAAVLVPLLAMIAQTSTVVNRTVQSNDRGAAVFETARKSLQRMGMFLRPAKLSSIRQSAIDEDVTAGLATAVGEWIDPIDGAPRPGIRFVAAEGFLSMNANLTTTPRELQFVVDPGTPDRGRIVALYENTRLVMADEIEACSFTTDSRMLRVTLTVARRDNSGNVYRATLSQSFFIRNN